MLTLNNCIEITRINKPIGIWLLLWPCFIGLSITESANLGDYILFSLGAVFLRSAGCIINDIFDAKFDAQVKRSKNRPLAKKSITLKDAVILTGICLILGLLIFLQLSNSAKILSVIAAIMMAIYPLLKRITYWPQVFLGLTFNIGFLIAILHKGTNINQNHLIIYFALTLWTLFYDTIYAFADIKDDLKIGVKSSAIKMQNHSKFYLSIINFFMCSILAFALKKLPFYLYIVSFFYNQYLLYKWHVDEDISAIKTFKLCHLFGLGMWAFLEIVRIIAPQ